MGESREYNESVIEVQLERLQAPEINYMELNEKAGAFSCGKCIFADRKRSYCTNQSVRAFVSATHGCCNLYQPARRGEPLDPDEWAIWEHL